MSDLSALVGTTVRAKRLGWDVPPEGKATENDFIDPPAWRDDELPEDVEGELEAQEYAGDEVVGPRTWYAVDGVPVDPATVESV